MRIIVKVGTTDTREIPLELSPSETIDSVKKLINAAASEFDPSQQQLIFEGKMLENPDQTLEDVKISDGNVVHLILDAPNRKRAFSGSDRPAKEGKNDVFYQSILEFVGNSTWEVRGFSKGNVLLDKVEMKHGVNIEDCKDTTIRIAGKANHILINRCFDSEVELISVVSALEVVHAKNVTIRFTSKVPMVQVDLSSEVNFRLLSSTEDLIQTKFVNANSSDVNIYLEDKELKFPVPTSLFSDQMASRVSYSIEKDKFFLKTLSTQTMEKEGVISLSLLDSQDKSASKAKESVQKTL